MAGASEVWVPVPGYEGAYEVSDHGSVRSVDRVLSDGRTSGGVILRQFPDSKGYLRVNLRKGARSGTKRVHTLVAEAFLGRRPHGMQILHRDDDHSRNGIADIRYGTPEANVRERVRRERRVKRKGKKTETGETGGSGDWVSLVSPPVAAGQCGDPR